MIAGAVSAKLSPQIKLILVGRGAQEVEIEANIDTQFTAGVSLPRLEIEAFFSSASLV